MTRTSSSSRSPATWRCGWVGRQTRSSWSRSAASTRPSRRPPGFPTLNRLAITLSSGDNPTFSLAVPISRSPRTRCSSAPRRSCRSHAGPASLDGMLSFDALIHLNPFGLEIDFAASLTITVDGQTAARHHGLRADQRARPVADQRPREHQPAVHLGQRQLPLQLGSGTPPAPPPPTRVIDLLAARSRQPGQLERAAAVGRGHRDACSRPPTSGTEMRAHPLGSLTLLPAHRAARARAAEVRRHRASPGRPSSR